MPEKIAHADLAKQLPRLASQPTADITWNDDGSPHCPRIDANDSNNREVTPPTTNDGGDDYFSRHGGLAESRYIFLAGNHCRAGKVRPFSIAELGFGTGLNLAAVLRERRFAVDDNLPWLSYWTVEHRPLTAADFIRSHRNGRNYSPNGKPLKPPIHRPGTAGTRACCSAIVCGWFMPGTTH